jgi:hypothetical protein
MRLLFILAIITIVIADCPREKPANTIRSRIFIEGDNIYLSDAWVKIAQIRNMNNPSGRFIITHIERDECRKAVTFDVVSSVGGRIWRNLDARDETILRRYEHEL